ncbi:motility associated factor glycosyltransferase family protein [Litchfieldia salsa]|uniref:DUF115 domain-containing protein n=1 Tax=Litchfieldia salsa TaxID=930152 RepID=A0A1H0WD99_9BACI|nr:6-hydroxymethylpterin diphosphokinase MptE-like protein [Litchfieldia salsa]SDP88730.1 Protein of unknown function DUF115 [Litchfieldia salsa]
MITWEVSETRKLPTLIINRNGNGSCYVYSKYDPEKEITRWINSISIDEDKDNILLFGMGLGYHTKALREKYPEKRICVLELNEDFYYWFNKSPFFESLNGESKVEYLYLAKDGSNYHEFNSKLTCDRSEIVIIKPLLDLTPNKYVELKDMLLNIEVSKRSFKAHEQIMTENFNKNILRKDKGINPWLGKYKGRSMILVSAGPSLTKQLPLLLALRKNTDVIIGCVGTALNPLIMEGIKPDFFMISESNENLKQIQNINDKDSSIPFFYLATANNKVVEGYNGPTFIVWQKGFHQSEEQSFKRSEPLVDTGGSVATCLLDLMMKMEPNAIALIGQDLAFTNNMSHASNADAVRSDISGSLKIDDYYLKEQVTTSRNLFIYLKWFERYCALKRQDTVLYNCTEGGAHIKGWNHISLSEYSDKNLNSKE